MNPTPQIFEYTIKVSSNDLDELEHVNNVRYVQWMEDIAKRHWNEVAPEDIKQKYIWMVVRHEIDYKGQAFKGDELLLQTYVGEHTHVTSQRHVVIRNKKTEKILIQALSTWCLLDAETKRPAKITEGMFKEFYR
jgi:acyl-CoA thioester hydrolase